MRRKRASAAHLLGAAIAALASGLLPGLEQNALAGADAPWSIGGSAGAAPPATSPLSGVVRAAGRPVSGVTLLVRGLVAGATASVQTVRTEADGTFVVAAAPGIYTLVSLTPGFRPVIARVLHRAERGLVSFVALEMEPEAALPKTLLGSADPWAARAVATGDPLRETEAVLLPEEAAAAPATPATTAGSTPATADASRASVVPVHASLSSIAGVETLRGATLSKTSLDVSGRVGDGFRWDVEGDYSRSVDGLRVGDSSRVAFGVTGGTGHEFRVASSRDVLPEGEDGHRSRYAAHSVNWSKRTPSGSHASVSARVVSQSNLLRSSPASDLFAESSKAVEVNARYRAEMESSSLRFDVAYRTLSTPAIDAVLDRETRVGGGAAVRLFRYLRVEGGATGDFSERARGVTPEVTVSLEAPGGTTRAYVFAARRYETREFDQAEPGYVGADVEDLSRLSRTTLRFGIRHEDGRGTGFSLEAARREIVGTYRYILDQNIVEGLESLYFLSGDVANELSSTASFRVGEGLNGKLTARGGTIEGERFATISRDQAVYALVGTALLITATRTEVGIGYRSVSQTLLRHDVELRNDLAAVDLSVAQAVPISVLKSFGSELRALVSVELGKRREGSSAYRANRQVAGGLAFDF